ncbi:MAG TPA: ribosomal protein L13e [Nitrososphaera sp.]|jgi:large subunit ribosomal protein L13e
MQAAKPIVRNGYIVRAGRGYSLGELKEAGLDSRTARKGGMPVDVWRQTKHPENVEQLKSIVKTSEPRQSAKKSKKKKE